MDELERLADVAYGEYTTAAWRLRDKVSARRTARADTRAGDADETAADCPCRAGDEDQRPGAETGAETGDERGAGDSA